MGNKSATINNPHREMSFAEKAMWLINTMVIFALLGAYWPTIAKFQAWTVADVLVAEAPLWPFLGVFFVTSSFAITLALSIMRWAKGVAPLVKMMGSFGVMCVAALNHYLNITPNMNSLFSHGWEAALYTLIVMIVMIAMASVSVMSMHAAQSEYSAEE